MNLIKIRQAVLKGYIEMESGNVCDTAFPTSKLRRGRVQGEYGSISPTITCGNELVRIYKEEVNVSMDTMEREINLEETDVNKSNGEKTKKVRYRIRKLTPEECFILQGMTASDVEKCRKLGLSDSELYKQAGNGICSNCVELLAERLFQNQENNNILTTDMYYDRLRKKTELAK